MPLTPRQLCANLAQSCGNRSLAWQGEKVLAFLCNIANGAGYTSFLLCDPDTGIPVVVRFLFALDGDISSEEDAIAAFNVDGSPYVGNVANLIACSGGGGGGAAPLSAATFLPATEILAAAVTPGFTVALTNIDDLVYMLLINETDQTVELSFDDGTTSHVVLNPQESRKLDLATNRRRYNGNIELKYRGGTAPLNGSVRIEAYA